MRAFSAYFKKGNQNIDELIGEHDLLSCGYEIHNWQYVGRYGRFLRLLRDLEFKPMPADKRAYFNKEYTRGMESAKFWAIFPHDADDYSPTEKKRIKQKLNFEYKQKK